MAAVGTNNGKFQPNQTWERQAGGQDGVSYIHKINILHFAINIAWSKHVNITIEEAQGIYIYSVLYLRYTYTTMVYEDMVIGTQDRLSEAPSTILALMLGELGRGSWWVVPPWV